MSTRVDGCFACEWPPMPMYADAVVKSDDLPLCPTHWNWWIIRWLNADDEPPCGAHLIDTEKTTTKGDE